jgi:hypothetical protein
MSKGMDDHEYLRRQSLGLSIQAPIPRRSVPNIGAEREVADT